MTDLVAMATDLAQSWGRLSDPLRLVVNRENAVFEAQFDDGRHGALRLHREGYQTADYILSELRWTERLARAGFRCPTPLRTYDERLIVQQVGAPIASLIGWIDAAQIGAMGEGLEESPRTYREVGALIGALHKTTDDIDLTGISRPAWSVETLLSDTPAWGCFWDNPSLSVGERDVLEIARTQARAALEEIDAPDIGLIHADLLQENILRDDDGLWIIDFDDAGVGYRLYDLGTALIQHIEDVRYVEISEALAEGYEMTRGVSVSSNDLELFTLLRGLASCGWVISRVPKDDLRQRVYAERALCLAKRFLA